MNNKTAGFRVSDISYFKQQMLNWANRFNIFIFLDSHDYPDPCSREEWILAAGVQRECAPTENVFQQLKQTLAQHPGWWFGHFNYELGLRVEGMESRHPDRLGFPEVYLFQPRWIIRKKGDAIEITSDAGDQDSIFSEIQSSTPAPSRQEQTEFRSRISRQDYLDTIHRLKEHILRGDCYEINFCQEFFAENASIDPIGVYRRLSEVSPAPFAGCYKRNEAFLLCASPERFACKMGSKVISQPIKGTARRNTSDPAADEQLKLELQASQKERSENVMVVDLVRNDLGKICRRGSVKVEELYGVYSFPQVHQLISTVSGELKEGYGLPELLQAAFPMGSMTGAPKKRVMELTEQYEQSRRGIYSGSIGYIRPDGDFDFNVVIRSIMYNQASRYLSYHVGGGITFYSDAEKEYEECLLKAAAIKKVLG